MKGCKYFERLEKACVEPAVWYAKHKDHGGLTIDDSFHHPSKNWVWVVCKCGHRYLTSREDAQRAVAS